MKTTIPDFTRISLGAPAGSSGAGTGAYRFCGPGRGGKEGVEDMTRKFGYYFVPRLAEFTGQMDKLPFDAHWFVALTAPRPWISPTNNSAASITAASLINSQRTRFLQTKWRRNENEDNSC